MARRRRPPRPGALTELPPLKILSQIFILQALWYLSSTLLMLFTALVAGRPFTMSLVLSWQTLRGDTTWGFMLALIWLLNSSFAVIAFLLLVSRSKMVLDFAITLHFFHLVVTSLYSNSVPQNWLWWLLQVASTGLMTSLGIWSCQRRELRPMTFGASSAAPATSEETMDLDPSEGDEEQGFGRGVRRGRERSGAGEYEMVGLISSKNQPED